MQSSNLYVAQHFGLELQSRGLQIPLYAIAQDGVPMSKRKGSLDFYPGSARIDFSA